MKTKTERANLKELEKLGGKVKYIHIHKGMGQAGTQALVKVDSKFYYGEARCSDKDYFSKKIGRAIALGRAMKNYKNNGTANIEDIPDALKFREEKEKLAEA